MKKYYTIFILIVPVLLNSQVVSIFPKFENLNLLWHSQIKASALSDSILLYGSFENNIIANDNLYSHYNIIDKNFIQGYLVRKLDLSNGNVLWDKYYNSTLINTRRCAHYSYFENADFNLLYFKEFKSSPQLPFWAESYLGHQTFSLSNGDFQEKIKIDSLDENIKSLIIPYNLGRNVRTRIYPVLGMNKYKYFQFYPNRPYNVVLESYTLSNQGYTLDSSSIQLPYNYSLVSMLTINKNEKEMSTLIHSSNGADSLQGLIYVCDHNLNIQKKLDISRYLPLSCQSHQILKYEENSYILQSTCSSTISYNTIFSRIDDNGNLLEQIWLDSVYGSAVCGINNNRMIIMYGKQENGNKLMEIALSDGKGKIDKKKSFAYLLPKSMEFTLIKTIPLSGGKLLLELSHKDTNIDIDPSPAFNTPNWSYLFCMDLKEIGLISKNKDITVAQKLKVYPNPCEEYISVNVLNYIPEFMEVKMFNLLGKLVLQKRLFEGSNLIDSNSLESGLYILEVIERNQIVKSEKIVKFD